jgi:DNA-binding transcriptional MerR regulator
MYDIDFSKDKPLYTTSVVAEMLKVTPDRLRSYDKDKLVSTARVKTGQVSRRLYSQYDVEWLIAIRELVSTHFMSTNSVKAILKILYLNPSLKLPDDTLGVIYARLQANPNLKKIASTY